MFRVAILLSLFLFTACSSNEEDYPSSGIQESFESDELVDQEAVEEKNKFLAYKHDISITLEKSKLAKVFKSVIDTCTADTEHNCIIMESQLTGGDYAYGIVRLRVSPKGVPKYRKLAADEGDVASETTEAEDLTDAVVDTEKRLEMLASYQAKLKELEKNPNIDIESLIKIASEIAEVQTQIEFSKGQKAKLYQRVTMDVLTISLNTPRDAYYISPLSEALSSFVSDLSEGLAILITASAYLLPWLIVIGFIVGFIRFLIIKRKTKLGERKARSLNN